MYKMALVDYPLHFHRGISYTAPNHKSPRGTIGLIYMIADSGLTFQFLHRSNDIYQ